MKISTFSLSKIVFVRLYLILFSCLFVTSVNSQAQSQSVPKQIKQLLLIGKHQQAATELRKLSNQGSKAAQYQLALLYLSGNGVTKSINKAIKLLSVSADGYPKAAYLLATQYLKKESNDYNLKKGIHYLSIASQAGNKQASKRLEEVNQNSNGTQHKPQTQALFELALNSGDLSLVVKQYLKGANLNNKNSRDETPLLMTIKNKRFDIVRWLLKQNVNVNVIDRNRNTALHLLAEIGKLDLIILLSEKLKSLNETNDQNNTAILISLLNGHQQTAQWLLNNGANDTIINHAGVSAFSYAKANNLSLVKSLSHSKNEKQETNRAVEKQQQNYALKKLKQLSEQADSSYYQWPILHIAVAQHQNKLARFILSQGSSPWQHNQNGRSSITIAMENKQFQLAQYFLDVEPIQSQKSRTQLKELLLFLASTTHTGQTSMWIQSIVKQASILNMMGIVNDALLIAIKTKNSLVSTQLLKINLLRIDKELFFSSIPFASVEMMKQIIKKDVDLNWTDDSGKTALIVAAKYKNAALLQYLLSQNPLIDHSDDQGLTALMWSINQDCLECVRNLLNKNASTKTESNIGNTPLMAASSSSAEILSLLLSKHHELSLRNRHSLTALMIAVKKRCFKCTKLLLDAGANPRRKNEIGQDSFDLALKDQTYLTLLDEY